MISVNIRSYSKTYSRNANNILTLPACEGIMGILTNHENMITSLKPGIIVVDNQPQFFISDGVANIQSNIIDIISDFIIDVNNISVENIEKVILQMKSCVESSKNYIEIEKYRKNLAFYLLFKEYSISL